MSKKISICICGGGSLGHTIAGYVGAKANCEVNILTNSPERWHHEIIVEDNTGKIFKGAIATASSDPADVIPQSDIVLLCLPGFAIAETLQKIKPFITTKQCVGSIVSSTGFFFMAAEILDAATGRFGFQRVPFIARTTEYGKSASLLGYKSLLKVATVNIPTPGSFAQCLSELFDTPVALLGNYLEAALTNSNPLLHTVRLYTLFKDYTDGKTYPVQSRFYEDWTNETSELLVACDNEFQALLDKLPVDKQEIPSLLRYYESRDAWSLTQKIRSILAFKGLLAPMKKISEQEFVPDFGSRYFTEDFPYGLAIIKSVAMRVGQETPHIDTVLQWAHSVLGTNLFDRATVLPVTL